MAKANQVRGEIEVKLGKNTYLLKPEHSRAVLLDQALPLGVLGTLLRLTQEQSIKIQEIAIMIHCLLDPEETLPSVEELEGEILDHGLIKMTVIASAILGTIAGGNRPGEGEASQSSGTDSTGTND